MNAPPPATTSARIARTGTSMPPRTRPEMVTTEDPNLITDRTRPVRWFGTTD